MRSVEEDTETGRPDGSLNREHVRIVRDIPTEDLEVRRVRLVGVDLTVRPSVTGPEREGATVRAEVEDLRTLERERNIILSRKDLLEVRREFRRTGERDREGDSHLSPHGE